MAFIGSLLRPGRPAIAAICLLAVGGAARDAAATPYSDLITAADPVAYWRLGTKSGGGVDATDLSGNGYDGTATGNPGTTGGALTGDANAAYQGGSGKYVAVPQLGAMTGSKAVTVETWIRVKDAFANQSETFQGIFDSTQDNYVMYLDRGNKELRFKAATANGAAERPGVSGRWLDQHLNEWIHVVGVLDPNDAAGTSAKIYVNGVLRDRHTLAALDSIIPAGQLAAIGADFNNGNPNRFFTGGIDDVAIYNRALTEQEIVGHYETGSGKAVEFPQAIDPRADFKVVGHRGNSMFAPENTSESNRQAARIGADYFEVDVRLTKDGQAVLSHDDSLARTTGTSGTVSGKTLAELQALEANYATKFGGKYTGEKIPTLAETFLLAKAEQSGIVLDVKVNNAGAAIRQAMDATGFDPGRAIAFGWNDVSVADLAGNLPDASSIFHIGFWGTFAGLADTAARDGYLDTLVALGVDGLVLDFYAMVGANAAIQEDLLILAALKDLDLFAYTVNDPVDMADLMSLRFERMVDGKLIVGQFAGIITDDPETALRVLGRDAEVPEPDALPILAAGGLLVGRLRRRRA
ncbi:glycerophosphodiester phosphodiesterase family protein [Desertibaculum subflavum]|uniref:glycerophosphodiester phosphodiesterase family protein n=1 Tax=Desertibaculum subflavum TaxID=2268458 RepID=UPI000E6643C1